ncbi:hypothetical protein PUN28_004641 [Cardiocondyla obscurior]|uniref:Uncharacterized protein n=2 Tax=Cardiocondyla obscurior TaxID=286306 RepID=A0AAW2GEZ5_9HYME
MMASCHKAKESCVKREIAEVDAKILHLTGPSPRCESKDTKILMEQKRLLWMSKARELRNVQSAKIQRIKNLNAMEKWRLDKRSFNKSMEKISKRNEDDIPFAIDIEDYPLIQKRPQNAGDYANSHEHEKLGSVNINRKIQELSKLLENFDIAKLETLTPKSKRKYLQTEMEKLSHFQKEVHNLKRYNDIIAAPQNSPLNTSS